MLSATFFGRPAMSALLKWIDASTAAAAAAATASLASQAQVAIYENETVAKPQHENGVAHVTVTKLVWVCADGRYGLEMPLELVGSLEAIPGYWQKSPKLLVVGRAPERPQQPQQPPQQLLTPEAAMLQAMFPSVHISVLAQTLVAHNGNADEAANELLGRDLSKLGGPVAAVQQHQQQPIQQQQTSQRWAFKLSFRGGGMQPFHDALKDAIDARAWLKASASSSVSVSSSSSSFAASPLSAAGSGGMRAGIAAIKYNFEKSQQETTETMEASFKDLSALMSKAGDLVTIADKLTRKLEREGNEEERSELRSYLLSMGISNPVTKQTAGSKYHEDLSKQLAGFLKSLLQQRSTGMMALPDVFCFFNRARGTALVSPEDLLKACELFSTLGLPVVFRVLPSGVQLVQLSSFRDDALADRIASAVANKGKLSALELAQKDAISVVLAREQLLITESRGLICRDDAPEGLLFYPNMFSAKT